MSREVDSTVRSGHIAMIEKDAPSLFDYLDDPSCPLCRATPMGVWKLQRPHRIGVACIKKPCTWHVVLPFPRLRKQIVYLDTALVSSLAKAPMDSKNGPLYSELKAALLRATRSQSLACIVSPLVHRELQLARDYSGLDGVCAELETVRAREDEGVHLRQLERGLWLWMQDPFSEVDVPLSECDAFEDPVHEWMPRSRPRWLFPVVTDALIDRRNSKEAGCSGVSEVIERYSKSMLPFSEIAALETGGFGKGLIDSGLRAEVARRKVCDGTHSIDPRAILDEHYILPTAFDELRGQLQSRYRVAPRRTLRLTIEYLRSRMVQRLPVAVLRGKLQAAIAVEARPPKGRPVSESDGYDLAHISTFAPYVDVLVTDSYFENVCKKPIYGISTARKTRIESWRPHRVPEVINWLRSVESNSESAKLLERVNAMEGNSTNHVTAAAYLVVALQGPTRI